jgi:hypothetical protein
MWDGTHDWPVDMGSTPSQSTPSPPPPPIPAASPPRPRRSKDTRAEAWASYVSACVESGTPQERAWARDYLYWQARREAYLG